jgi:hypothetical protein
MVQAAALLKFFINNIALLPTRPSFSSNISILAAGYGCFGSNGKINAEVGKLNGDVGKLIGQLIK